jgi:DNA primase
LPEGQDADGLLRDQGPATFEGLIASARHWLEWRLDRLLAPLLSTAGEPALETLQAVEREGRALVEQLPDGVLRRSAQQRLNGALQGTVTESGATNLQPQASPTLCELCTATARQRAEHRALRLFVHAAECRGLLRCLALQDPACRLAMEWLSSLSLVAVDGSIASMALQLVGELPGAVGAAIAQAVDPGQDVVALLQRDPQAELQALLEVLEPISPLEHH